ncbi:transcriptional repressor [Thermosipho ferrireducens]|uniref:Transcriptional repressor n=1 Tax=Thermosipho ferrireducens TaxID=2571116 RepID=A0ABX7SB04_9BACT|nr:transcriptional repressor [Thermosipho ferrireducens]QTA38656.1 transcriptional repressor [Thermosipho ferrireducens]
MEKVVRILTKHGVRPTLQRIHILKFVMKHKNHMSAEEIFRLLQKEVPGISRATVYNTLNLLSEEGILLEIVTPGSVRYDYVEEPHHHFYCERCKKIYDLHDEIPLFNIKEIEGHKVKRVEYYIVGICRHCLNGGE